MECWRRGEKKKLYWCLWWHVFCFRGISITSKARWDLPLPNNKTLVGWYSTKLDWQSLWHRDFQIFIEHLQVISFLPVAINGQIKYWKCFDASKQGLHTQLQLVKNTTAHLPSNRCYCESTTLCLCPPHQNLLYGESAPSPHPLHCHHEKLLSSRAYKKSQPFWQWDSLETSPRSTPGEKAAPFQYRHSKTGNISSDGHWQTLLVVAAPEQPQWNGLMDNHLHPLIHQMMRYNSVVGEILSMSHAVCGSLAKPSLSRRGTSTARSKINLWRPVQLQWDLHTLKSHFKWYT